MHRWILLALLPGLLAVSASAQVVQIVEAEVCTVRRANGGRPEFLPTSWASGGKKLGFWGIDRGDRIESKLNLPCRETRLKLAVRYAYHQAAHERDVGPQPRDRKLTLTIDGGPPLDVPVPDTGSWDDFACAYIDLPALDRGAHTLVLSSPGEHVTTDVDALIYFRGDPEKVLPAPLRSTVVIRSADRRFVVRMTPKAVVRRSPQQIVSDFSRIYDHFRAYMGWEPDRPIINVCIYEKPLARGAYENAFGVHFEDENFNWDRGNWIHEMNHVFDNGLFPAWTGHPMIRVNDTFAVGPYVFPGLWGGPAKDSQWRVRLDAGRRVLDDATYRTDDAREILYALYVKFGKDLLRRFYAECREAKARGEIRLVRQHPLTRDQYVEFMSRAAGQDVRPYFQQWNGFKDEK